MPSRRLLQWSLALAVAAGLAFGLAHTGPAKRLARSLTARVIARAVEGRASLSELDYELWRGHFVLTGLAIAGEAPLAIDAAAERMELRISPALEVEIDVARPRITIGRGESGDDGPAADVSPPTWLARLRVEDGSLTWEEDGDARVHIEGVTLDASGGGDELHGVVHAPEGNAYGVSLGAIDADLYWTPNVLRVASASLLRDDFFARLEGDVRLVDGALRIQALEARGFGGSARASGILGWTASSENRLELTFEDLDGEAVASALDPEAPRLDARLGGRAELRFTGWDLLGGEAEARLELAEGSEVEGAIAASLAERSVRVARSRLSIPAVATSIELSGTLSENGGIDIDVSASTDLHRASPLEATLPIDVEGSLTANGRLSGTLRAPRLDASLASRELRVADYPHELAGTITSDGRELALGSLRVDGPLGVVSATGNAPTSAAGDWDIVATIEGALRGELQLSGPALAPDWQVSLLHEPSSGRAELRATKSGAELDGELVADGLRLEELARLPAELEDLEAELSLRTRLLGTIDAPRAEGSLRADGLRHGSLTLPPIEAVWVSDTTAASLHADVRGRRLLEGELTLTDDYPLALDVTLDAFPLDAFLALAPERAGLAAAEWSLAGAAHIDVPLADPAAARYRATVDSLRARDAEWQLEASPFTFEGDLEAVRVIGLDVHGSQAFMRVDGIVPLSVDGALDVTTSANLGLGLLEPFVPGLEIEGRAVLEARLAGTPHSPSFEGDFELLESSGTLGPLAWSELVASGRLREDRVERLDASAKLFGGTATLRGALPLAESSVAQTLELRVSDIDLLPETAALSLITSFGGTLAVSAPSLQAIQGSGTVDRMTVSARGRQNQLAGPAPWSLDGGVLTMPELAIEGERGRAVLSLDALRLEPELALDAGLAGRLDASFANALLVESGVAVGGTIDLDARARFAHEELTLSGEGALVDGSLVAIEPRFSLSAVEARFTLSETEARVEDLTAVAGTGSISGGGSIGFGPEGRLTLDLRAAAEQIPLEVMDGLRVEASGQLALDTAQGGPRLSGTLRLDRGLLTRELDADDASLSAQQLSLADPGLTPSALDGLALDVSIGTDRNVRVENSLAQLEAGGNLSIRGTLGAPELGGFVNLVPDGTFNVGRNRFQVLSGRVDLAGFPSVPPNVRIVAITRIGTTLINLDLEGDIDDLRTRLSAPESPDLTEGDLASLLVTGRTLENAGEGGQQIASTWMMSSLADLVHDGLGDLISFGPPPGAGPLILSEEADPTTRLTLGFPVTERLSVTYSIALDSTERRLWILDYRIARNVWLRAIQENANDYSFGLSQRFELNLRDTARRGPRTAREKVQRVELVGAPEGFAEAPKLREGDIYDYWSARDEASRIEAKLVESGYPSAVVDVQASPSAEGSLALRFQVTAGEATRFVWRGDDPGGAIKKATESSWDGRIPEGFLLPDLVAQIRTSLQADRYYFAQVEAEVVESDDGRTVVFDTARGPRGSEIRLGFDGHAVLGAEELAAALPEPGTRAFFTLLERPAELERGLRLRYAAEGHLDATIGEPRTRFDPSDGSLRVEIPIVEGESTPIRSVTVAGADSIPEPSVLEELGIEIGRPVQFPAIREGQTRLRTRYRSEGFPDVRVRAELERGEEGLDVRVSVEEGARSVIGDIRILGNQRTRAAVIRNQLTFDARDPVRVIDFQETQKRLYDLGVFRSADVRTDPQQQGQEIQDVIIQVVERADLDVNYGLRYNVLSSEQSVDRETEPRSQGLEAVARLNLINQLGRGTNLGFSIFYQTRYRLFRTTFRLPTFFGRRIITELSADTETENDTLGIQDFDSRGQSFTFQQSRKLTDDRYEKFSVQWNVRHSRFQGSRFVEGEELQEVSTKRTRFGVSLVEDRRDSFANPTRGRLWNITLQGVPEAWGSDIGYLRVFGQYFHYQRLWRSLVWAAGARLGFVSGTKELILIEDRFLSGGANSVRGFKQNTLGPSVVVPETGERLFVGGQAVGVFNQELRFPLYKALHGGVFWDAGNVFTTASEFTLTNLRHTLGAGLRVVLPFGALSFDFAEALNAQMNDETVWFHFAFGYAF